MCTREERREEVLDVMIPLFGEISGLHGGVDGSTLVFMKNREKLFYESCRGLKCKGTYSYGLFTMNDFAYHFMELLDKKELFVEELSKVVEEFTGREYGKDEILFHEYLPKSTDKVQNKREEIDYALRLSKVKIRIANYCNYFPENAEYMKANTFRKLAKIFYWRR